MLHYIHCNIKWCSLLFCVLQAYLYHRSLAGATPSVKTCGKKRKTQHRPAAGAQQHSRRRPRRRENPAVSTRPAGSGQARCRTRGCEGLQYTSAVGNSSRTPAGSLFCDEFHRLWSRGAAAAARTTAELVLVSA